MPASLKKVDTACCICGSSIHYLDNIGTSNTPHWVCSDSEACKERAHV
ncbi:hypothetical protein ACNR1V_005104 [Escherichia coli]